LVSSSSFNNVLLLNGSLVTPDALEAEDRPGRKSRRTLTNTPGGGQPCLRALDDRFQPGVPPTDDFGGPLGKGALCHRRSTAVPVGPPRPSSITHPEAATATVTCTYIVSWHMRIGRTRRLRWRSRADVAQHHSPGGCPGDCGLHLHCRLAHGWHMAQMDSWLGQFGTRHDDDEALLRVQHIGRVGFDASIFAPGTCRSPLSPPTCDVPFPPRRSGEYRKGMIPARPLYQGVRGSGWDPEPSRERVGDCCVPATVFLPLVCCQKACHKAKRRVGV
jgi:hypothetical protein